MALGLPKIMEMPLLTENRLKILENLWKATKSNIWKKRYDWLALLINLFYSIQEIRVIKIEI